MLLAVAQAARMRLEPASALCSACWSHSGEGRHFANSVRLRNQPLLSSVEQYSSAGEGANRRRRKASPGRWEQRWAMVMRKREGGGGC